MKLADCVEHTKKWIEQVVISWNFCPFAKRPYYEGRIRFSVLQIASVDDLLSGLVTEYELLEKDDKIETTLIIVPEGLNDFDDYLDCLSVLEDQLAARGYDGIYQIASFHPEYIFEGSDENDPANYTNRSPYPMFHLLREESLGEAIDNYEGDVESIPSDNINHARLLGIKKLKNMLDSAKH